MITTAILWLSLTLYAEARGETEKGKIAVAAVTMNRVRDKEHPSTVYKVVNAKGAYTWNKHLKIKDKKAYNECRRIASLYLRGSLRNPIGKRTYFNQKRLGKRYHTKYKPIVIGNHIFY